MTKVKVKYALWAILYGLIISQMAQIFLFMIPFDWLEERENFEKNIIEHIIKILCNSAHIEHA